MITTKHMEKELSIQIIGVPDEKIKSNKTESIHDNIKEETFSWVKKDFSLEINRVLQGKYLQER